MRNVQAHAVQGQQLPRDWRIQASLRAQQANSDYMERLQSAWSVPLQTLAVMLCGLLLMTMQGSMGSPRSHCQEEEEVTSKRGELAIQAGTTSVSLSLEIDRSSSVENNR